MLLYSSDMWVAVSRYGRMRLAPGHGGRGLEKQSEICGSGYEWWRRQLNGNSDERRRNITIDDQYWCQPHSGLEWPVLMSASLRTWTTGIDVSLTPELNDQYWCQPHSGFERPVLMSASLRTSGVKGEQQHQHFNRVSSQNGHVNMAELWCNTT